MSIALGLLIYKAGISRTLSERKLNKYLSARISWLNEVKAKVPEITENAFSSEKYAQHNLVLGGGSHERLLAILSGYCGSNPVKLIEFPAEVVHEKNQLIIHTSQFVCSGSFRELLRLVEFIENDRMIGKIRSADFSMFTDRRSGVSSLRLKVYVENVTQKSIQ